MDARHDNRKEPVRGTEPERTGSLYARKALVIGLTGGIATGKTTVASILRKLGARVVSADEIVHDLLSPGSDVYAAVVREFGEGILDTQGRVDRRKLGEVVFREPAKRAKLESIIHPPVLGQLAREAEDFRRTGDGVLVLEIPLLVETSSLGLVDKVLVVTAEQETQVKRLQKRYCISREEAILRIGSQLPVSEKAKYADWVVSTEGTSRGTVEQVSRVWDAIQKSLAHPK